MTQPMISSTAHRAIPRAAGRHPSGDRGLPSRAPRVEPTSHATGSLQAALGLLADLADVDVDWLLTHGVEQQIIANLELTREGQVPDALYFVLDGLIGVRLRCVGAEPIRTLGPGEIVGEMSFLEDVPAAATASAVENSLVLCFPRALLDAKLDADPEFGVRLYRAFARSLSRRLRESNAALGRVTGARAHVDAATTNRWTVIDARLADFKRLLAEVDHLALENDGVVPAETQAMLNEQFLAFAAWLNEQIGDGSPDAPEVRQELGARLQREVLPYVFLTTHAERWYSKPRGYAGDFLSIEHMYQDQAEGTGRLGPALDRCFLELPAAHAVCNRRGLLTAEILKTVAAQEGPVRVLSMACGPARELFDACEQLEDPTRLVATCLDIDMQALAFVADARDRRKLKARFRLEQANLVYLATGRQNLELPPQDLAYSIGLIDYFNDAFVVRLLDFVYDKLRPGGRVILGNFHPKNPSKALMDYVFDWRLIHRDEADMNRLFARSKFGRPCDRIAFEAAGVNLFASCARA